MVHIGTDDFVKVGDSVFAEGEDFVELVREEVYEVGYGEVVLGFVCGYSVDVSGY